MIEINLVPPELRKKKKSGMFGGLQIPMEVVIGSAGGLIMLLFIVHLSLLVINISRMNTHKSLKTQWEQMLPQKEIVDGVMNNMRQLQTKYNDITNTLEGSDILWAKKLNMVSENIPRGVWLSQVAFNDNIFYLDGSAISRGSNEMISVHNFTSSLKRSEDFMTDFSDLELGSINTRTVDKTDIADFLITLKIQGSVDDGN